MFHSEGDAFSSNYELYTYTKGGLNLKRIVLYDMS